MDEMPVGEKGGNGEDLSPTGTRNEIVRLSLVALAAVLSWAGAWRLFAPVDAIAIVASLVGGYPVYVETYRSLLHRRVNMEASMALAIAASLLTEQFTAAVVITFFVLLSEYIEGYAVDRGRATVTKLERSIPKVALVSRDGEPVEVGLQTIKPNDVVIVRDGERVPVDGVVIKGSASVNQAPITGEALPVEKNPGSEVFAGSVNASGLIEVRTERVGNETVYGKIIRLVEEAEGKKAPVQKISDRLAAWLVESAVVFAGITFLVTGNVISTLSVIVVAGACGVAAGTPLALVATIGYLAKKGVIAKGGIYIQEMSKVDTVVIDKTGTLTFGEPEVTDVACLDDCTDQQLLAYAASAEELSNHPLARAITVRARQAGVVASTNVSPNYLAGRGMVSHWDGQEVVVGNRVLMLERNVGLPREADTVDRRMVSEGKTSVLVAHGGRICGVIGLSDRIRAQSKMAIAGLERMGIDTVMLTGDNKVAAKAVGDAVGIDHVHAELLPHEKVSVVEKLVANGHRVAMVGDGVNDAPALARASVGIGMGAGTDVAIEEADVVLMTNDLARIPAMIEKSRNAYRTIMVNFYGTILVDGIGMSLAFLGMLSPLPAAGIHVVSELMFILNSARLIR